MKLRTVVGISLLVFCFAVAGLVLFGYFGQDQSSRSAITFTAGVFGLFLFVFGTAYILYAKQLEGVLQHCLVILAVLLVSVGFALAASNLKDTYLTAKSTSQAGQSLESAISSLQANRTLYLNSINYMNAVLQKLDQNITTLGQQIESQSALANQGQQALIAQQQAYLAQQALQQPSQAVQATPASQPPAQTTQPAQTQPVSQRRTYGDDD